MLALAGIAAIFCRCRDDPAAAPGRLPAGRGGNVAFTLVRAALRARSRELLSLPNCAVEVLVHAWRHGLVVLISNVFAHHLRVQEAVTANAAMPLVAGEDVRTPLGAFRVVFGIGHFNNQRRRALRRNHNAKSTMSVRQCPSTTGQSA